MLPVRASVDRLQLTAFRNHAALCLVTEGKSVALTGLNGAGKTNVLEALSLLTPGRGLRRAVLTDIVPVQTPQQGWTVFAHVESISGAAQLGTGLVLTPEGMSRRSRIDGATVSSPAAFCEHVRVSWLTPAMDGLFMGAAGDRRRFLDRLVLSVDPEHGSRVSKFDRALRARNKLLEVSSPDARWLDGLEHEIAELGVAVAAARAETVARLQGLIAESRDTASPFPWASVRLEGWIERAVLEEPASVVEERYQASLRERRSRDAAAGRATDGPHISDLLIFYGQKDIAAAQCSTGEQKALLLGLILAHARLVGRLSGMMPLLLLDEVVAHLDPERRLALYDALEQMNAQAWLTGADPAAFRQLEGHMALFGIVPGLATRHI
jgi:DNA replication and repair protein RecF